MPSSYVPEDSERPALDEQLRVLAAIHGDADLDDWALFDDPGDGGRSLAA